MAHDSVIEARVKQTVQANRKCAVASRGDGDLVCLSTKNIKPPKGRARKLMPKYLGPFKILKTVEDGAAYQLELSKELKTRGIHDVFHASLLRPHVPNDDRRFPGRMPEQIPGFLDQQAEWAADAIRSRRGGGKAKRLRDLVEVRGHHMGTLSGSGSPSGDAELL